MSASVAPGLIMSDLFEAVRLFITNAGSRSRLEVGGELDVATVGPFGDHLALLVDAGTGDVDVDMALVTFCDAAPLRALITVHEQLNIHGRRLRVVNASRPVLRLLQLTDLDTMLCGQITEDRSFDSCPRDRHRTDMARARKEVLNADRQAPERFAG
jgi:anti-anti-sigma factor